MGIGKRIGRIIRSNVNNLLDSAEDPEKQLALMISEMEDSLRQAKQLLVRELAREKRLGIQLDEADETAAKWAARAKTAVDQGRDDLAREALREKKKYEQLAIEYDGQLADQQNAVDQLRVQYREMEQRLQEARGKEQALRAKLAQRSASAGRSRSSTRQIDAGPLMDRSAFDKFDEMAEKVETLEAESAAHRELSDLLEGEDRLAAEIDGLAPPRTPRRDASEVNADIELEELRERTSRRRRTSARDLEAEAETPPAAGPAVRRSRRREVDDVMDSSSPAGGSTPPSDDDDTGGDGGGDDWGRRVEL